jgi:endoglucanase
MRVTPARAARSISIGISILLAATLTMIGARPAAAATADLTVYSEWTGGYVAAFAIDNDAAATTTSWRVEFDLPAGTDVATSWGADLTRVGSHHVFTNLPWNGTLVAGASTSFGWVARGNGAPVNCIVNGARCDGGTVDTEPPTAPDNVRVSVSGIEASVSWTASTDNVGVVGYRVTFDGNVIANGPATSVGHRMPDPGWHVFGVSAYDAAGNVSPAVQVGATTEQPSPSASASRPA